MILQFSFSNFRSFRQLQTLNLAASGYDKTLPDNCISNDLPGLSGKRWVKGIALYGPNASGKTTLLRALEALRGIVGTSARTTDPKEPISAIEPFALNSEDQKNPTGFALVFVTGGVRYEYRVAATREQIWHESLRAFPKGKEQLWFNRGWNAGSGTYDWSPERPTGFERDPQLESYTLPNVLFLSKAFASNRSELEPIYRWFSDRLKFLDLKPRSRVGLMFTLQRIQERTPFHDKIVSLLRHADLGVTDARAVDRRPPEEEVEKFASDIPPEIREKIIRDRWLQPELVHRGMNSAEIALPWSAESAGTHRFFSLSGPWLDILANGYVACIDELETSMHPLMVTQLLKVFCSPEHNPSGAQILFTTHNPLLLDPTLLRRDQIWFTDKKETGESFLYPLTDYQPRKGESLVRGYLSGRYGAVPFIPNGLLGSFPAHSVLDAVEGACDER